MEAILNRQEQNIGMGKDAIVIIKALTDIPGGATIDVSGLPADAKYVQAGHVIVKTTNGDYKALGVTSDAYATKGTTDVFVGVLKASVLKSDPRGAIVTAGMVNAAASPYALTDDIKKGLPLIQFMY